MKAYIEMPPEFELYLAEENLTFNEFLEMENIEVDEISQELNPAPEEGQEGTRAVLTVLIGTAAVLAAAGNAVSRVMKTRNNRPRESYRLEEIRDADGNVIIGNDGKPLMKKQPILLETTKNTTDETEISAAGVVLKWGNSDTVA